ncbi:MAG TPA: alpha/beta hydrolase-fold protein [Terriglobales bacterium]|nr:alpha/beta hydrolase-fold protein [Terriglobales bacterium]
MSQPFRPATLSVLSRLALLAVLGCAVWSCPASAQTAARPQSAAPVPLDAAPPSSPQIQPDGTVIFRLAMPNAAKVELHLEGAKDPFPMTKAADGTWSVSVPGLAPQYYSYSFSVDGIHVLDPHNVTLKPSFFNVDNVFLVPGHPPLAWEPADVPHGVVHHHYYHSTIVGINSEYYVYTPPGFDPASKQKYPVLYLLHGYSDDPSAWTSMGKANVILDNLLAQGKVKPMIVVMPLGYGTMEVISRGWTTWRDPELIRRNYTRFSDALFQEVMPLVKQEYPLSDKREDHAVAGLSMGGAESLRVGLNHIDDFAYVGGFSSAPVGGVDYASVFPGISEQSAPGINARLRLLWISCGTEDGLFDGNQKFIAFLKQKGLQPTAIQTPGMHVWTVWRDNLSHFAPLLFQSK